MGWWVADLWNDNPVRLVSWAVWVIGSIVLHELAHGWAAIRCGDNTPIETGHMSLNPLVHMGQTSLIVFAIVGIAWGAMPVNPSRMKGRHADALVSAAGPAMNLLLAIVALLGLVVWIAAAGGYWFAFNAPDTLFKNMQIFLSTGAMLNIVLMLFNLMPVPPLDGSHIAMHYFPSYRRLFQSEQGQLVAMGLFVLLFWFGGDLLFSIADNTVQTVTDALLSFVAPRAV